MTKDSKGLKYPIHTSPIYHDDEIVRPTLVEINLSRLRQNYKAIKDQVRPAKMMPVLKANAYGHGLVRVAKLMQELNADALGVAFLEEGVLLRRQGIALPILVLGGVLGNQVPHFIEHDLMITASSIEKLQQIDEAAAHMGKTAKVHLILDTGMERIGVHYYHAKDYIKAAVSCRHIAIQGVFTHLANADDSDLTHARQQLERFNEALSYFTRLGVPVPARHAANSGAVLQLPEACFEMVRPGLMLYGVYPSLQTRRTVDVKPALTWKSRVVYFKVIKPGHPVGYGSTWQSDHLVRAVTVPVGYGDGYFRSMSGKAQVLINGKRYPVVGRISMDQIVVNIERDSAYNNDEVVLLGEMDGQVLSAEEMADWAGTIPYEILTNINTRVPRIYVNEQ